MKLSPHFSLEEFTYSSTALARGIDNNVPNKYINSLINLCNHCLEPLRDAVKEPVIISSGYRCQTLNNIVGGSKNSQHMKGEAADIYVDNTLKLRQWFEILK